MITKIGDFLRKLRLDNQQILKDMAEVLGVSSAFLSAVENGKKSMAFNLIFVSNEKTLSVEEVDAAIKKILTALKDKLGAELR